MSFERMSAVVPRGVAAGTRAAPEEGAAPPVACPNCGLTQVCGSRRIVNEHVSCPRCLTPLAHPLAKSLDATLALCVAILVLLLPALVEPFMTTEAFSATRTSRLPMSALDLWQGGWPWLAAAVFLFVLAFPVTRFGLLTTVLVALRTGWRPRWLGAAFRLSCVLQTWAMLDVFLLGLAVAYARLRASLLVNLDAGAYCFAAAALLTLVARATLDRARVWSAIKADHYRGDGTSAIPCRSCEYWLPNAPAGCRCPRCSGPVRRRRVDGVLRSVALLSAAALLYLPANLYPIATIPIELTPTSYTVLGGVVDLAKSHLLGLAVLVFCASFTIPVLKMLGLTWCLISTRTRSRAHLVAKTRVYRVIEEIGRWSMVDPLTIACFVPVLHFNGLINGRAEAAATPFAAVAILTTLAVKSFDPRVMWDAASLRHG